MDDTLLAATDSSTTMSGESAFGILLVAALLVWAMSKGGRK